MAMQKFVTATVSGGPVPCRDKVASSLYKSGQTSSCMVGSQVTIHMHIITFSGQLLSPQDCLPSAPHEDALLANTNISVDELSSLSARSIGRQNNGLLIIIPDRTFSCYGFVSSWTDILSMEAASVPLSQELVIYLQVWRPLDNGAFDLVGSKSLVLNTMTFCETLSTTDIYLGVAGDTHYRTFTGSEEEGTSGGVAFQPGDVIGCFIPGVPATNGSSSTASLGLAVRNGSGHRSDREVDLLVYPVDGDICEAAVACEGTQVIISSVQPQIYPHQCKSRRKTIVSKLEVSFIARQ